ncbi:MAG: MarR family transcriptional regulator [Bacteroidetes bacterium]|nr:MAG: MarR family transcriptional regulator [Bacteroidota bacterium]
MKPEETIDYHVRAVWYGIFKMYNQAGLQHDITTSLGYVLLNIHTEGGTPATKIAPLMGMESRSLSRMLKSMEEKGLIYKQQDEIDKRSVIIFLTKEGIRRKEISRKTVREFNEKLREIVPSKDLESFFRVMTTVNQEIIKAKY